LAGKIPHTKIRRLSEAEVLENAREVLRIILAETDYPKEKIYLYFARWVCAYYPGLAKLPAEFGVKFWNASYVTNYERHYSWSEFLQINQGTTEILPDGIDASDLWQFATRAKLPCCPHRLDYNEYPGRQEDWQELMFPTSETDTNDPPPEEDTPAQTYQSIVKALDVLRLTIDLIEDLLEKLWSKTYG